MEAEGNTITFRLPPEMHKRLVFLAEQSGITKHAMSRSIVVRALDATDQKQVTTMLAAIEDELKASRTALGRGVGAILQNVTDLGDDAIRKWVAERLLGGTDGMEENQTEQRDE